MSGRFEFRGSLATTPLPEVLHTVYQYRVPGVVALTHEGIEKKIFLWNGEVIFATSGDRRDSLGDYLLRLGKLSEKDFDRSVEVLLSSGGGKRHGDVLVEMGLLTAGELEAIVYAQVKEIVISGFNWEEGEVGFQVGTYRTDELIQLSIPARQMILEGIKAIRDAKRLVTLLGPSWTLFDPCPDRADLSDVGLDAREAAFLETVDGTKTLRELIALGPGDAQHNARLIYAFHTLRLVARRDAAAKSAIKIQWKTGGGAFTPTG